MMMPMPIFPDDRKLIAYSNATKNAEYDNVYIFSPIFWLPCDDSLTRPSCPITFKVNWVNLVNFQYLK